MRQSKLIYIILLLTSTQAFSQKLKFGLTASPTVQWSRITSAETDSVEGGGSSLQFIFGLVMDYQFSERYHFGSGILLTTKRATSVFTRSSGNTIEEKYGLQYLVIPATIKMYTNEIALDTKIYFQIGGVFEFKIDEEPHEKDYTQTDGIRFFDMSAMFGTGIEYQLGANTLLFAGVAYQRGLIDQISIASGQKSFNLKNDLIAINLGIKF